jgi:hypothetical protein
MLPDGSPDWNAYYTGYPSPGAHVFGAPQAAPQGGGTQTSASALDNAAPPPHPGYEGYPPPPPLPPQP